MEKGDLSGAFSSYDTYNHTFRFGSRAWKWYPSHHHRRGPGGQKIGVYKYTSAYIEKRGFVSPSTEWGKEKDLNTKKSRPGKGGGPH